MFLLSHINIWKKNGAPKQNKNPQPSEIKKFAHQLTSKLNKLVNPTSLKSFKLPLVTQDIIKFL